MRLVPVNCVKEESFLAKTIYDSSGRVLLAKGYKLTLPVLKKVEMNGIHSMYINDQHSYNEIEDFIKPELRQKAIKVIKGSFEGLAKYNELNNKRDSKQDIKVRYQHVENIIKIARDIVEEIALQKDMLINLVDIKSMDN